MEQDIAKITLNCKRKCDLKLRNNLIVVLLRNLDGSEIFQNKEHAILVSLQDKQEGGIEFTSEIK